MPFHPAQSIRHAVQQHNVKLLKATMVLAISRCMSYALSFVRNAIIARMITQAEFGFVLMMAGAMSSLEFVYRLSIGRQLIQAKDGDTVEFQASAHSFQLLGGILSGLLFVVFAVPLASVLDVPEHWWAFAVLGIVPILRGIEHSDYCRIQRDYKFLPAAAHEVVPQVIVTVACAPIIAWLGAIPGVVSLILLRGLMTVIVSHLLSSRPYRLAWERAVMSRLWEFGWPLLVNGFVMFLASQGDQLLIGAFYSLSELAPFGISAALVAVPWFIMAYVGSSLFLPILSRKAESGTIGQTYANLIFEVTFALTSYVLFPMIILGEYIVTFVYGAGYEGAGPLVAVLTMAVVLRSWRFCSGLCAMALGDTRNQMEANILRSLSLIGVAAGAILHWPIISLAWIAVGAESISGIWAMHLLHKRHGIQTIPSSRLLVSVAMILMTAILYSASPFAAISIGVRFLLGCCFLGVMIAATWRTVWFGIREIRSPSEPPKCERVKCAVG